MPPPRTITTAADAAPARALALWIRRVLRTTAVLPMAALMLASCSEPQLAPSAPVPTPKATNGVKGLHLPIEAYMLTASQAADYNWVRQAATGSCMRRFGQDYPVPPQPSTEGSQMYGLLERRYGIADAQSARIFGYHQPHSNAGPGGTAATQPVTLGQLSDSARTVLTGGDPKTGARVTEYAGKELPEHGCLAELERLMPSAAGGPGGPASGGEGLVTEIKAQTFTDSQTDAPVTSAIAAWSTCMKSHGYDIHDPLSATAHMDSLSDPAPDAKEIAQAQTDVACKSDTNLIGIWFAAESDRQNALINRHADDLSKIKQTLATEVTDLAKLRARDWNAATPS
ncbi:hypothetical protein [Kitasatospora aureofaciens]|uniref:hypothetical protein n=1 Tax=Kitasatospora aureofaciens TaxID=1894 RepID=UPI000689DC27|nr:hypothetical protein [Kitasatospora aureofaciens]